MGSVHKFKRPPKNTQQFQGYRPNPTTLPPGGKPGARQLRDWQKTAIAWSVLVVLATAGWVIANIL